MAKRRRKSRRPDRTQKPDDKRKAAGADSGGRKADEKKEERGRKSKSPARNLVETIVIVAILVLVIRFLFLEAFKIPSSSMEPALIGHPYHGDRVLAWKPSVKWTTPERWSVNVFVKHADEYERLRGDDGDKNYIKRLIGLPGERVLIAGGDIFIEARGTAEAEIARKPPALQEDLWHTVYEGRQPARSWRLGRGLRFTGSDGGGSDAVIRGEAEGAAWARFSRNRYEDDGGLVTNLYVKRLLLRVRCPGATSGSAERPAPPIRSTAGEVGPAGEAAGPLTGRDCAAEFKESIRTARTRFNCPSCGREIDVLRDGVVEGKRPWYPETRKQEVPVGDLRVSFDVAPERVATHENGLRQVVSDERGFVLVELTRDDERYLARVPLGGGEAAVTGPHGVDAKAEVAPFGLARAKRLSFAHVDQTVVLALDGTEIIRQEYDLSWTERAGTPEANSVRIGLEGACLSFANLRVERDLHYLSRGSGTVVEFYWCERARGRWRDIPATGVPGMPPHIGSAPAVRTRERLDEDEYFFMGDNSSSSYDSRMWGTVAEQDMVGRAFFGFWPPHHVGWMR